MSLMVAGVKFEINLSSLARLTGRTTRHAHHGQDSSTTLIVNHIEDEQLRWHDQTGVGEKEYLNGLYPEVPVSDHVQTEVGLGRGATAP